MELEILKTIIEKTLGRTVDPLTEKTTFVDDLGMDSLDFFQMLIDLEETYDIHIDAEDAEEIVQETFIKLWETRDKIKVELNFNTYITTIAKNLIYDMFRKKLVEQRYYQKFQSLIQEQLAVENELFRKNLQEVMFDSINKLSEQQREVMMLKCKGFNNDEIAELLGISKRTVEAHLNKAYKKLRQDLGEVRYYLLFFTFLLN